MKTVNYMICGLILLSVMGFAGSYIVDEDMNLMSNDIYNVTSVNTTNVNTVGIDTTNIDATNIDATNIEVDVLCLNLDCTFNMSNSCTYYPGGNYIC